MVLLDARLVALVGRDCEITIRETYQKQDFIITGLCMYVCMVYLSRGKVEKGRPFISPITPSAAIVVRSFHAAQEKWRWCLSGIGCRGEGYHDNPLGGRDAAGGD